jgi:hypothetical protein
MELKPLSKNNLSGKITKNNLSGQLTNGDLSEELKLQPEYYEKVVGNISNEIKEKGLKRSGNTKKRR